jgi:kumamolisin
MFNRCSYSAALGLALAAPALVMSALLAPARAANIPLPQSIVRFAPNVVVMGEADPSTIVHFQVALRLRDRDGLEASIAANKILTPSEFAERHLPAQADYNAVLAWLRAEGLTIDRLAANRMTIWVSGRVAVASSALGAHFSRIVSEGHNFTAADTAPSIPEALSGTVLAINGLQPNLHAHTQIRPAQAGVYEAPYLPSDFKNAYAANGLGNGAGTTTAILIDTFPAKSDLTTYWKRAGAASSLANFTFISVQPDEALNPPGDETSLDSEISSTVAPGSKIRVYASGTLYNSALDDALLRIISDLQEGVKIDQLSISLGECETYYPVAAADTDDQYFATMTALGTTVFVSSGDQGSNVCATSTPSVSFFASSPHVTAVGGTTLAMRGTSVGSETAWDDSTGGISAIFAVPSYQSSYHYARRAVPDISADANPATGAMIVLNGSIEDVGGTSLAAPLNAALFALVNAKRIAAGKPPLGGLNSRIYALVKTANFRDIVSGSNGAYTAGIGYDLVTGIGAPLLSKLLPVLVGQP